MQSKFTNFWSSKNDLFIPVFSLGDFILFVIFCLSLQQLSMEIAHNGVSIGYWFLLLFIIPVRNFRMTVSAWKYMIVFCAIYLIGLPVLLSHNLDYQIRTTLSFGAFLAPFLLLFIRFKKSDLRLFIYAIILAALMHSTTSIDRFLLHRNIKDFFMLKDIIGGGTRYGFVLCFGFFLMLYEKNVNMYIKTLFLSIIFMGILLTFNRAAFLGLFSILFLILVTKVYTLIFVKRELKLKNPRLVLFFMLAVVCIIYYFRVQLVHLWGFYNSHLISNFFDGHMFANIKSAEDVFINTGPAGIKVFKQLGSVGGRIYLWSLIASYLSTHLLTGSHFSGLYLLFKEFHGSASSHSQYMDVLLRTGLIGFSCYVVILYKIARFFQKKHKGIFYGFLSVLIFGFFNETFKEGQGAFIFAFLLSYQFWMRKERDNQEEI